MRVYMVYKGIMNAVDAKLVRSDSMIDLPRAIKMRFLNGNTYTEIGKLFNVSKQAIEQALRPFKRLMADQNSLQAYNDNYKSILKNANMVLMGGMLDPDKLKDASLNNVAYAFNTVANHQRLEEGKSTDNIGVSGVVDVLIKDRDGLLAARTKLLQRVDKLVDNPENSIEPAELDLVG